MIWTRGTASVWVLACIFLAGVGNRLNAQLEFSYTGIETHLENKVLSDIPLELNTYHLTWTFFNAAYSEGELGLGGGNAKIPAQNHNWSDLVSKGLFSAHFQYTRHFGFGYLSAGIRFQKITGDVTAPVAGENSVSGFDKFIQHNSYYFYEFPVSAGVWFHFRDLAIRVGVLQSNYFGTQNYTQYLYQGLGNVEINRGQRTFQDQDADRFFETEFAFNLKGKYRIKIYYSFPVNPNDPAAGLTNPDQRTIRVFFGGMIN